MSSNKRRGGKPQTQHQSIDPLATRAAEAIGEAIGTESGAFAAALAPEQLKRIMSESKLTETMLLILAALPPLRDVSRNALEGFLRGMFRQAKERKAELAGMDEDGQRAVLKTDALEEWKKLKGQKAQPAKPASNSFEALHGLNDEDFNNFEEMLAAMSDEDLNAFLTTFAAGEVTDKVMVVLARFKDAGIQKKFRDRFVKVAAPKKEEEKKGFGQTIGDAAKGITDAVVAVEKAMKLEVKPEDPVEIAKREQIEEDRKQSRKNMRDQLASTPSSRGARGLLDRIFGR